MTKPANYMYPKELSFAVKLERGLDLTTDRVRAIRTVSEARKDGTFLDGRATVSGLMEWIRLNPDFRQRPGQTRRNQRSAVKVTIL